MDWKAEWFWIDNISPTVVGGPYKHTRVQGILERDKNNWAMFRKCFEITLDQDLDTITGNFYISVDSRYKLFINGNYIGRGIYRCNKHVWYYDEYDVTGFLHRGKNVICILVQYFGEPMSWYEMFPHGGLSNRNMGKGFAMFQLELASEEGTRYICSDKTTKATACQAYEWTLKRPEVGLPYIEIFDSRKWPIEWLTTNFDDSEWNELLPLENVNMWPTLVKCDIPRLDEARLRAKKLLHDGIIDRFFDEDEVRESLTSDNAQEDPIDFSMQMAFSDINEDIPELIDEWNQDPQRPITFILNNKKPIGLVFDMGKEVSGFIYFKLECNIAGCIVDICWSETLDTNRSIPRPAFDGINAKMNSRYICRKGMNDHEMFHWQGFRYFQVNFYPPDGVFKKQESDEVIIKLLDIGTNLYLYPVDECGKFFSENKAFNKLFEACNWTLRNCMHDGYEDCPSCEQRQWIGDAYVEIMLNYALFGDTALAKKLIKQAAQSQRGDGLTKMVTPGDIEIHGVHIPDYCLYWISIIWEYYWYTGDVEILKEMFPRILVAVNWFINYIDDATGLITDVAQWIFIDWSVNDKWGACGALNVQFYHCLRQIISMAEVLGLKESTRDFAQIANRIKDAINTFYWDEARKAYIDAVRVGKDGSIIQKSHKVSFHTNSLVILHDICPDTRKKMIIENVFKQPDSNLFVNQRDPIWQEYDTPKKLDEYKHVIMAEPFFMHHVNQMFAKIGRDDLIVRFFEIGWCKMLEHDATTIWESWGNGRSLCHAWSATPAHELLRHCLGVKITKPGASEIEISPMLFGLESASGTVPTYKGLVDVNWMYKPDEKTFTLHYKAPESIGTTLVPPKINDKLPVVKEIIEFHGNPKKKGVKWCYKP